MKIVQTFQPVAGETALAVVPRLDLRSDDITHWSRRAFYTAGRVLTPATLVQEQATRAARIATLSRALAPGVVRGFESLVRAGPGLIAVGAGLALNQAGEDVPLGHAVQVASASLGVAPESLRSAAAGWRTEDIAALDAEEFWTLPALRAKFALLQAPLAAVLLARPVTLPRAPTRQAPCAGEPAEIQQDIFFEDGTLLEWYLWPAQDWPLPPKGTAWRNRIAWSVFDRERAGEAAPWLASGAPVALVGFDTDGTVLFVDRQAVVREGGGRRARRPLLAGCGDEPLWQAQVLQLAEHLSELPDTLLVADRTGASTQGLAAEFDRLPPCGVLPRGVADLERGAQGFFPGNWQIEARVVTEDIVQTLLAESASLSPLAFGADASIDLLVPVPAADFDADLLRLDVPVNPLFRIEIGRLTARRDELARERDGWLRRHDSVAHAASGLWPERPDVDGTGLQDEHGPAKGAFFRRTHRGGPVAGIGLEAHGFAGATETFVLRAGDRLAVYVELPPGPVAPFLLLQPLLRVPTSTANPETVEMQPGQIFWWSVGTIPPTVANVAPTSLREAGRLPALIAADAEPGERWRRLEIDASFLGVTKANPTLTLEGLCYGVIADANQNVNWGHAGSVAAGQERFWVSDLLPVGARIESSGPLAAADAAAEAPWPWSADAVELPVIEGLTDDGTRRIFTEIDNLYVGAANNRANIELHVAQKTGTTTTPLPIALDRGVVRLIEALDRKGRAANDQVEFGFLRSRVDLYRLRARLLGEQEANRLLTSPGIAQLVQRSETSFATETELTDFLGSPRIVAAHVPSTGATVRAAKTAALASSARASVARSASLFLTSKPVPVVVARPPESRPFLGEIPADKAPRSDLASIVDRSLAVFVPGASQPIPAAQPAPAPSESTVAGASSFNISVNSTTLGERLKDAPAVDTWSAAVTGKASNVLASASALRDLQMPVGDLPVFGFKAGNAAVGDVTGLLGADRTNLKAVEDDDTGFKNEADYFKVSVDAIDNGIRFFRGVETLVEEYRALRLAAEAVQVRLVALLQRCVDAIAALERQLGEVRHDLGVARALLEEERARVDAIVTHRRGVLRERVRFLAYRRPRLANRLDDLPVRTVEASITTSPVPACLDAHDIAPDILRMTHAMRDLPARHFVHFAQTLGAINDRLELLDLVRSAATRPLLLAETDADDDPAPTKPALAIKTLKASMTERARMHTAQRLAIDVRAAGTAAHSGLLQVAFEHVAVSDLLLGRRTLATSGELDDIARVAACLVSSAQRVDPALRLTWAMALSEFDQAPSLRNLANLPRFGAPDLGLEFGDWRAMQQLVDWLFSRIDATSLEAESMMNDLVRIALLLASHAPVKNLIPARLAMPVRPVPGIRVELAVDAIAAVRLGMNVSLAAADGTPQATAVVRDIAPGRVSAEVVTSQPAPALLDTAAVVHLYFAGAARR